MFCSVFLVLFCGRFASWRTTGGIGWGHNMKFRMGLNMMDMVGVVSKRLSDVKFPFLIMHDPQDGKEINFSRPDL